jgi:hypothetical protein
MGDRRIPGDSGAIASSKSPHGDQFLAATLPTILNSLAFQTQRSAIFITWDEDYDNLYLGIGNEGKHIAMIVIPSPNSGCGKATSSP